MKRLTIMNRIWGFLIGSVLATILIMALPIGCKSVSKTQTNKEEAVKVSKSDSSSVKSYTVIDTTKTDSSTEITTYTITADSVDFYDYTPKGDLSGEIVKPNFGTPMGYVKVKTAKGVKITGTTKTQKSIVNKGETTQAVNQQTDVKSDSVVAKKETLNETTKTAHPIKIIIGIGLLLFVIAGALYLYYKP